MRIVALALIPLLIAGSAASAKERDKDIQGERASDNLDKMVCKRFQKTGSLVDSYKTCKTKREWEYNRNNIRTGNWNSNGCPTAGAGC